MGSSMIQMEFKQQYGMDQALILHRWELVQVGFGAHHIFELGWIGLGLEQARGRLATLLILTNSSFSLVEAHGSSGQCVSKKKFFLIDVLYP